MKTVKLYAYFAQNLGDDLMIRLLVNRYPNVRFYSESWGDFPDCPNLVTWETLQRKYGRLNHLLNILTGYRFRDAYLNAVRRYYNRKCGCSVYIGGSIYMQRSSALQQLAQEEEKLRNGPLFVIGANFGPFREAGFPEVFAGFFRRCGGVMFREKASFERFCHLDNVGYASDVVLNLQAAPRKPEGTVLISVIDLEHREGLSPLQSHYENWMASLCEACVQAGKRPVLLSFCRAEGDERAVGRILEQLSAPIRAQTEALFYRGNADEILAAYASADRVIATRFHAMILALCFEKPVFALSYSEKVQNVLEDLEFDGFCSLPRLEECTPAEALNRCGLPRNLDAYRQAAREQFAQLDIWL